MKYIVTRPGKCVCPKWSKPKRNKFSQSPHEQQMWEDELQEQIKAWEEHVASLPEYDCDPSLPVGSEFEGVRKCKYNGKCMKERCLTHCCDEILIVPVQEETKVVPQDTLFLEEIYAVCSTEFGLLEFPWTEGEKGQQRLLHFLRSQLTKYQHVQEAAEKEREAKQSEK
jgi:hypothetical protein